MHVDSFPPPLVKLLAHNIRWHLIIALAHSDRRVQELVAIVDKPVNLVSYHLKQLREGQLVQERRSSADARDVYYSLNLDAVASQFRDAEVQLHPGLLQTVPQASAAPSITEAASIRILFLCTHNSARSQMAEALLRELGATGVDVQSAGTEPARVHELAVQVMSEMGIDIANQRSKHVSEFLGETFDYIITVCDRAREECPVFPGDPEQIHWSFADPAEVKGGKEAQLAVFRKVGLQLNTRLRYFWLAINRV